MAITPKIRLAFKAVKPVGRWNNSCKNGVTITMPKKPKTTDGMLASSSIKGLRISFCLGPANSFRYKALPTPRGTQTITAPRVTQAEASIRGRIPNSGGS
jgi:hypothetical protein